MKRFSRLISFIIAAATTISSFGALSVSAAVIPQELPYYNTFDTNGDLLDTEGWKKVIPSGTIKIEGNQLQSSGGTNVYWRWVELDLETISSGTVVFEFDAYFGGSGATINGGAWKTGDVGLFDVYNDKGDWISSIYAEDRSSIYARHDSAEHYYGGPTYSTKMVTDTFFQLDSASRIKVEVDLDTKKWRVYQNIIGTKTVRQWKITGDGTVNRPSSTEFDLNKSATSYNVSKISFGMRNNYAIDNIKIYQKFSETNERYDLLVGGSCDAGHTLPSNLAASDMVWESSDNSVATVSQGRIEAKGAGFAYITGISKSKCVKVTCDVKVWEKAQDITIDQADSIIYTGEKKRLTYSTVPKATNAGTVTWQSSNTQVATVDANGWVEGKSAGVAVITAQSQYGGQAQYVIEVVTFNENTTVVTMSNPDFASSLSGWTSTVGSASYSSTENAPGSSGGSAKLSGTKIYLQQNISGLLEGGRYTLSYYVKIKSLGNGVLAGTELGYKGANYYTRENYFGPTDGWQLRRLEFTVPKNAQNPYIRFYLLGTGEVYFDKVRITNQKDITALSLYSDGLLINSPVEDAPIRNAKLHYVKKTQTAPQFVVGIYEKDTLSYFTSSKITTPTTASINIANLVDVSKIKNDSSIGIFNWSNIETATATDRKTTLFSEDKTKMSSVYDFYVKKRMRAIYGGINDLFESTQNGSEIIGLVKDGSLNTVIFNIMGRHYTGEVSKDMYAFGRVLDDLVDVAKETGVKIFPKISFASNMTIPNAEFGEFTPGYAHSDYSTNGTTWDLPCPRSREYWKAQVTDVLSHVAMRKEFTGVVIDMEMYGGNGGTSYGSPCFCDDCVADFDRIYASGISGVAENERSYAATHTLKILEKYTNWQKQEITEITSEVRKALHDINPDLIIGYMPQYEWLAGITEGLGTHSMPVVIFNENEYKGDTSYMYGNQAFIKTYDMPAVYATGMWTDSTQAMPAANFAAGAVERAENSLGYWIYEAGRMLGDAEKDEYISALHSARNTIDSKYAQ